MVIIISVPSLRKLSSDPFQRKTRVNGHPGPISGMAAADFRHDVQTDLERLLGVLQISQFLITGAQGVPDVMFVWLLSQSRSVFPVSYTHLDVYKRQDVGRSEPEPGKSPNRPSI